MWNLILRTLRKKPDVTVVHSTENTRTFLVTIQPPIGGQPIEQDEMEGWLQDILEQADDLYDVNVQEIA